MNKSTYKEYDGVLIIDKPAGMTSRDVVDKVSKILGTKKVGHTGTLDPLATGVLVITIGKSNKLCDKLASEYKEYIATFTLGSETDTLDIEGTVVKQSSRLVSEKEIREAILSFKGTYLQEVPLYSAVKVDGRRLYDYARKGETVALPKREVEIKEIEILSIGAEIVIRCVVSKGTYIRSLIRDIGRKLGTYATMNELRRTKQGKFSIEEAVSLGDDMVSKIKSLEEVLDNLEVVEVDGDMLKKVTNGVKLDTKYSSSYVLFESSREKVALYEKCGDQYQMFIKY